MLKNSINRIAAAAAVFCALSTAAPAMAQYYTYVNPWSNSYYSPYYSTSVNPYYYNDGYYNYNRSGSAIRSAAKGAAIGGLVGLGVSALDGRRGGTLRNVGVGAGVGAGIGLLTNYLNRNRYDYWY